MDTDQRKGYSVSFRPRPAVKAVLQAAAEGSGRTLSEEIEHRVEQSFIVEAEFGSGERLAILRLVASTLRMTETLTGASALSSRSALQETRAALDAMFGSIIKGLSKPIDDRLDKMSPPGDIGRAAAGMAVNSAIDGQLAPIVTTSAPDLSPERAALEAEIVRIAAETKEDATPEAVLKWARAYPGGLVPALNEILAYSRRDKSKDGPTLTGWIKSQKTFAGDSNER
jgi:hypothetical protein